MFNTSSDKRIVESMDMILSALFRLMKSDSFELISVTEICQEALVARRTFYRNFQFKEDVVSYGICKSLEEATYIMNTATSGKEANLKFFEYCDKKKKYIKLLCDNHLTDLLKSNMSMFADINQFTARLFKDITTDTVLGSYFNGMVSSIVVHQLDTWTKRNMVETYQQLAEINYIMFGCFANIKI